MIHTPYIPNLTQTTRVTENRFSDFEIDLIVSILKDSIESVKEEGFRGRYKDEEVIKLTEYTLRRYQGNWREDVCFNCLGTGYKTEGSTSCAQEAVSKQHTTAPAQNVSLCVGCKSVDCSQRSEVGGIVTICAMRQG